VNGISDSLTCASLRAKEGEEGMRAERVAGRKGEGERGGKRGEALHAICLITSLYELVTVYSIKYFNIHCK